MKKKIELSGTLGGIPDQTEKKIKNTIPPDLGTKKGGGGISTSKTPPFKKRLY